MSSKFTRISPQWQHDSQENSQVNSKTQLSEFTYKLCHSGGAMQVSSNCSWTPSEFMCKRCCSFHKGGKASLNWLATNRCKPFHWCLLLPVLCFQAFPLIGYYMEAPHGNGHHGTCTLFPHDTCKYRNRMQVKDSPGLPFSRSLPFPFCWPHRATPRKKKEGTTDWDELPVFWFMPIPNKYCTFNNLRYLRIWEGRIITSHPLSCVPANNQ